MLQFSNSNLVSQSFSLKNFLLKKSLEKEVIELLPVSPKVFKLMS